MDDMRFDGDVVIVTGAGRGLGREYALAFARRGARVVVNDPSIDDQGVSVAEAVVAEIADAGGQAVADTHSVATAEGADAIVGSALSAFGGLSIVVNNAGVIDFATLEAISEDAWTRMIDVTLRGAFNMCRAAWPHLAASGHGRIINTTSNAGFAGNEQLVHYGAAKLGVAGLTRALAQEVGDTGITVNAIAPMAITRMNRDVFFGGSQSQSDDWAQDIRDGKAPMGPPVAVAPAVVWLAHRTTTINGEIFSVSSGKVARVGFIVGEGYFNPDHTPEDLRRHESQIRSLSDYIEPRNTADELAVIPLLFRTS